MVFFAILIKWIEFTSCSKESGNIPIFMTYTRFRGATVPFGTSFIANIEKKVRQKDFMHT